MAKQYDMPRKTSLADPADPRDMTAYIIETAKKYNIDPKVALKVAKSEGLSTFQSSVVKNGKREPSWGAFQLYTGGGLGNEYQKATGRDPSDPENEKDTIDYALRYASQHGWGSWYGAKNTGIGEWEGIGTGAKDAAPSDPTPNVGSGASDYAAETPSEVASKLGKKQFGEVAGDALSGLGQIYGESAKNVAKATPGSTTVAPAALPTPPPMQSMVDPRMIEMQRQQLAQAMQRLNSGKLV